MFKKIISIIGGCISFMVVPTWFIYTLQIRNILRFGFWGKGVNRIGTPLEIEVPQFEILGIPYEFAMGINYLLSYIVVISVFIILFFYIFKILNYIIHKYNDILHERKTERKFKKTKIDQFIYIISLILIIIIVGFTLLARYKPVIE